MDFKYLHRVSERVLWIDHSVLPEARAMFAAMMSRVPAGGVEARYKQVVDEIAKDIHPFHGFGYEFPWYFEGKQCWIVNCGHEIDTMIVQFVEKDSEKDSCMKIVRCDKLTACCSVAEECLTKYDKGKLHPVIQRFFDKFVLQYGHSSILELTGSPTIFVEHISWWLAYLTFDNPLVRGQEMSTRAVWRKDWIIAADAYEPQRVKYVEDRGIKVLGINKDLEELHSLGLEIAGHEMAAWKAERLEKCFECGGSGGSEEESCKLCKGTGQKHPDFDPQGAFRFAFDRARWALPGTIETGASHCGDLRTMARVIKVMEDLSVTSGHDVVMGIIEEIKEAYRQALPGMSGMGLREAVYENKGDNKSILDRDAAYRRLPGHLVTSEPIHDDEDVILRLFKSRHIADIADSGISVRNGKKSYIDPYWNHYSQADIQIRCSLACSRDWHRHRTFYPFRFRVIRNQVSDIEPYEDISIDHHYHPISKFGKENVDKYLKLATTLHDHYNSLGNTWMAMLCLPFGTRVLMHGQGGLRDAMYMMELRAHAHGANFEYKEQAFEMLEQANLELEADLGENRHMDYILGGDK